MLVVETERLALRHLKASDASALQAVFCDPEVMRYSDGILTPDGVRAWLRTMIDLRYPAWGFGLWALTETSSRAVIGYCGLERLPGRCEDQEAELGVRLARAFWGRGYATEAVSAARDYGLSVLGLPRIIAIVDPKNAASVRVLEKVGMTFARDISFPGYTHPDRLYAILRPRAGRE